MFEYHTPISQALFCLGLFFQVVKLGQGFVKYQVRRVLWNVFALVYVFMLSTIQIYNIYKGYIFFIVPLLCIRVNSWFIKGIYSLRPKSSEPIHKYLSDRDWLSVGVALPLTLIFTWFASGYLCGFQHLVCQQDQISLKVFDAK